MYNKVMENKQIFMHIFSTITLSSPRCAFSKLKKTLMNTSSPSNESITETSLINGLKFGESAKKIFLDPQRERKVERKFEQKRHKVSFQQQALPLKFNH